MSKKNIFYFSIILLIFLADRISKLWIISFFDSANNPNIEFLPFINLHLIWNKGIAFGLFSLSEKYNYNFLTLLIFIVIIVVFWMLLKPKDLKNMALYLFLEDH